MKLRQFGAALGGMLLAASLVACGGSQSSDTATTQSADSTEPAKYKIETDVAFAPFEYLGKSNEYEGIDVDLLAAIAKDQGFEYELDPVGFDAALQNVQSGQADGVIAGASITEERKEVFDFSDPYYDSTVCCAVKADSNIKSFEDLKDKNVATKTGTMSAKWAESLKDQYNFTTTEFKDSDIMYQDVTSGNSVACFEDTPVMKYAISTGSVDLSVIEEADAKSEWATPYGFAVKKGQNAELLKKFNDGLANIKKNGTYDEIVNKYVKADK
ncbi:MAG: transporter substrate-binding domain-containing protein [Coriobacteriales bacterium]|nr:transporter substrate-binding domain-containing protein [Coriobacteriales bacterium]